jgi:PKHD-type hydroxylase
MIYPFEIDSIPPYAYALKVFSPEECNKIIEIGNNFNVHNSKISGNSYNPNIRKSKNSWIELNKETQWIYDRLGQVIVNLNNKFFNFRLYGFGEYLQFTKYDEKGSFYDEHVDRGFKMPVRKMSVSVQLTDKREFKGGNLLIEKGKLHEDCYDIGSVVCFPSFINHKVTKIKKGMRYSLVTWITGDNFK